MGSDGQWVLIDSSGSLLCPVGCYVRLVADPGRRTPNITIEFGLLGF